MNYYIELCSDYQIDEGFEKKNGDSSAGTSLDSTFLTVHFPQLNWAWGKAIHVDFISLS